MKERERKTYELYVGDSLYCIQNQNMALTVKYSDLISQKKVDTRTGDEIVLDIINRANLKPKSGENE